MSIRIEQTYALIGMESTRVKQEMQTQMAKITLHQKHARVNIQTELPKVLIDQHDAFASAGLKNNGEIIAEAAQKGKQQALAFIAKETSDGKQLAAIENGGNPIPQMSRRDSFREHVFGLDLIPKVGPKIEVTGSISVEAEPNGEGINNGVEGEYSPARLEMKYTPGQVNTYLRQYASIKIEDVPNKIDEQA